MAPTPDMRGVLIKRRKFRHGCMGMTPCEGKAEAGVMCVQASGSRGGRSPPLLGGDADLQQEPLRSTSCQASSPRTDREEVSMATSHPVCGAS